MSSISLYFYTSVIVNLQATYGELLKKIQSVKEQLSKSLSDTSKHKSLQIELLRLNTMLEQLQEVCMRFGIVKNVKM